MDKSALRRALIRLSTMTTTTTTVRLEGATARPSDRSKTVTLYKLNYQLSSRHVCQIELIDYRGRTLCASR